MAKLKDRKCSWCGKPTERVCRICLTCCLNRDNATVYVPPDKRPGHRFYIRTNRKPSAKQIEAAAKLVASNKARKRG